MVEADLDYLRRMIARQVISGPVLELGTGYWVWRGHGAC